MDFLESEAYLLTQRNLDTLTLLCIAIRHSPST